jgi:hypothetical protein
VTVVADLDTDTDTERAADLLVDSRTKDNRRRPARMA